MDANTKCCSCDARACGVALARWVIGVPFSLPALEAKGPPDGEDLVIFDNLGSGMGSQIGFSEGGEAAVPFYPEKKPVDAYCACLLDRVVVSG